jgi:hypothetical protein
VQLWAETRRAVAKYGSTTRARLDYLIDRGLLSGYQLNRMDLERLWELVQAAEGLETIVNPVHARQRLRKALEALREANNGPLVEDPVEAAARRLEATAWGVDNE